MSLSQSPVISSTTIAGEPSAPSPAHWSQIVVSQSAPMVAGSALPVTYPKYRAPAVATTPRIDLARHQLYDLERVGGRLWKRSTQRSAGCSASESRGNTGALVERIEEVNAI